MLAAILRDAARQYRRRPAPVTATVLVLFVLQLGVWLAGDAGQPAGGRQDAGRAVLAMVVALAAFALGVLVELFLVAFLAANLAAEPTPVGDALTAARRWFRPGIRAGLLELAYVVIASLAGALLLGPRSGPVSDAELTILWIGTTPLVGLALAFLAVLRQRIVLGGQRRVWAAAAASHRVAGAYFPVCLLIGLSQAVGIGAGNVTLGLAQRLAACLLVATAAPFLVAMSNALDLRTRALHAVAPKRGDVP